METGEPQSVSAPRRPRWSPTRLGTLLTVIVVVGAACYGYVDHRRLAKARKDYEETQARYQVGLLPSILDLCDASRALAEAEQASSFVSTVSARARHLLRVSKMELQWQAFIQVAMFGEGGYEKALKTLAEVHRRRIDAQEWLSQALGE